MNPRHLLVTLATAALLLLALVPAARAAFSITEFDGATTTEAGTAYTQAGGHPFQVTTKVEFPTTTEALGEVIPDGSMKNVRVDLPAGFIGNPLAAERCTEADLAKDRCQIDSQVGLTNIFATDGSSTGDYPLYNMVPPPGFPAQFGFSIDGIVWVHLLASVDPDGSVAVTVSEVSQFVPLAGVTTEFWGVPADPVHDPDRTCHPVIAFGCEAGIPPKPFLSLGTACPGEQEWKVTASSWQEPASFVHASFLSHVPGEPTSLVANDGCGALDYSSPATKPSVTARPTTTVADSPSGLDVEVHVPQSEDPEGLATAHLKDTVITLPEGMSINPSSANGLEGCSSAQIGIDPGSGEPSAAAVSCPDASKIGSLEVKTPLLDHPAKGAVYIATPYDNPFDSLLAIYLVVDDPQSGTLLKLAGEVSADPSTGRLTTTVADAPQLPFEDFDVHLKEGAGAPLRTPGHCGTFTTEAELTPYSTPESGPPAELEDSYEITAAPGGGCPQSEAARPAAAGFDAGTVRPIAGAFSPLVVHLERSDGSQELSRLTLTPPPGLLASLAGIPYCSDAALAAASGRSGRDELASPSCPGASRLGTVATGAGAGPSPYNVIGSAYLAGPHAGAPLSVATIVPAVAGPYDLGSVVVRTALRVNPVTAQITAVTDPIPQILQGIPLDVRRLAISLDRPGWGLNPTSCDPMAFGGQMLTTLGQGSDLSSRFQVGECGALGFKPKLKLRLTGKTKRSGFPAFTATYVPRPGDANLRGLSLRFPRAVFIEQGHIGTVCTRVQFAADQCPARSIYGSVRATTPLLDQPLEGPVYLRSSDHELPDLVFDLRGQVDAEVSVRIDSVNQGLRSTIEAAPDVPLSKVVLKMQGGKKGLLVNSRDICAKPLRAAATFTAHNGVEVTGRPLLKPQCGKARKSRKAGKSRRAVP